MAATMDGFKAELEEMRKMVQLEETCADPTTLDAVKRAYRQKVGVAAGLGWGLTWRHSSCGSAAQAGAGCPGLPAWHA